MVGVLAVIARSAQDHAVKATSESRWLVYQKRASHGLARTNIEGFATYRF